MAGRNGGMEILTFMGLPERTKGFNIRFAWSSPRTEKYEKVIENTRSTANNILSACGHDKSTCYSVGEICGSLWQESIRVKNEILDMATPINRRRKTDTQKGDKMLSVFGKQINDYVTKKLCVVDDDSNDLYIAAVFKESKQDSSSLHSISKNIFTNEVEEDDGFSKVMNDHTVIDSLSLDPKRNIAFTSSEKDLELCLLDVIKNVIILFRLKLIKKIHNSQNVFNLLKRKLAIKK